MNKEIIETKISVIVPVYGVEKWVGRCVESLMEQTLAGYEVIFVDDCTLDGSIEAIKETLSHYNRPDVDVSIMCNPKNIGVNPSREAGLRKAHGEYVLFVDSDDYLEEDALESLYDSVKENDLDISYCDWAYVEEGIKTVSIYGCEPRKNSHITHLLRIRSGAGSLCNKLVRRSLFDGVVFPSNHFIEDWAVVMQLTLRATTFGYVERPLYNYRQHADSVCKKLDEASCERKRMAAVENVQLAEGLLSANGLLSKFEFDLMCCKILVRGLYERELTATRVGRRQWFKIFPGIGRKYIMSRQVSFRFRMGYLLKCVRMWI